MSYIPIQHLTLDGHTLDILYELDSSDWESGSIRYRFITQLKRIETNYLQIYKKPYAIFGITENPSDILKLYKDMDYIS